MSRVHGVGEKFNFRRDPKLDMILYVPTNLAVFEE